MTTEAMPIVSADITTMPLTRAEEVRLQHLEEIVETGLETFVHVGRALAAIRTGRLYRQTHGDFASYVRDRFGMTSSYAYRTMNAAEVAAIVSPIGNIENEAQARELVGLEPEKQVEVYQRAAAETAGRPTAKAIGRARDEIVPRPKQKPASGPSPARHRPHRRPLPEAYRSTLWEIEGKVSSLERLHRDDRFRPNRPAVAAESNRNQIARVVGRLQKLLDELADGQMQLGDES